MFTLNTNRNASAEANMAKANVCAGWLGWAAGARGEATPQ